jgi:predicted pyridoxine 5'-phosphate oxidase superfamily flavin-nucleotide-binding protein
MKQLKNNKIKAIRDILLGRSVMIGFKIQGNANIQAKSGCFYDNEIEEHTIKYNGVPMTEIIKIWRE